MNSEPAGSAAYSSEFQRKLENLNGSSGMDYAATMAKFRDEYKVEKGKEWEKLSELGGYTFSDVLHFELGALAGEQSGPKEPPAPPAVYANAHAAALSGLAFSGGGIRSATFNLGVIQALAQMKLLSHFDYLSTVSGGGYIGGWLSKWIKERGGDVRRVEQELADDGSSSLPRRQPWPVQFLRRYSNYLTPRIGFFSADTWTLICTYCRNAGLNMTMLFAWLAFCFLVPRFVLFAIPDISEKAPAPIWTGLAIVPFLWVVFCIAFSISRRGKLPARGWGSQSQSAVLWFICLPLIVAGFCGAIVVWGHRVGLARYWNNLPSSLWHHDSVWLAVPGLLYIAAWGAGWLLARTLNRDVPASQREGSASLVSQVGGHFASAVTALTIGTILLLKSVSALGPSEIRLPAVVLAALGSAFDGLGIPVQASGSGEISAVRLATFGMPVMLSLFAVTVTLMIGLIGRLYRDQSREWWARQAAWTVICVIGWLIVFGGAFYLPPLLDYAWTNAFKTTSAATVLTFLATAIGLKTGSGKATGTPNAVQSKELIAQIAPYAFMLLTIAVLSTVLQRLVAPVPAIDKNASVTDYIAAFENSSAAIGTAVLPDAAASGGNIRVLPLMAGLLLAAVVLGWRVDVNKFSLYMMYRLRLVRAYFGASTTNRSPHPFTGFDPQDDIKLSEMLDQTVGSKGIQRPYHLINAAVNMVGGKELAWQTRKAGNFCFTPKFCGFELPQMPWDGARNHSPRGAYRPTDLYASRSTVFKDDDAGVHLGMAVAVSGAAASPSMGYHSSPPLSFLMTLFNVRLGRWSPNPVRPRVWQRAAPYIGISSIVSELFGLTDTRANFLYLSDGGHFENLGLYELVRRRCRLIVAIDASADGQFEFGDLGNAIRKCQTDFNVPIRVKTSGIKSLGTPPPQAVSFVTGTIDYSQADGPAAQQGVLLYIKPNLVGDENADIANYSKLHPGFPHQSTADQWFDEDQFESYRALGYSAASAALREIAPALATAMAAGPMPRQGVTALICAVLEKRAGIKQDCTCQGCDCR